MAIGETLSFVSATDAASRGVEPELCLRAEKWHVEVIVLLCRQESQQGAWRLCEITA